MALHALALLTLVAITNGTVDESDKATVALLQHGEVFCTGVLVAPKVVATAGHCVVGYTPDQVYFGTDPKSGDGEFIDVAGFQAHPEFARKPKLVNDVALVGLASKAPATPVAVLEPGAMSTWVGTPIRLVGFGLVSGASDKAGTKRVGTTKIDQSDKTTFQFSADPSQTCEGDSGGPAFATIDGKRTLVGLTSAGDSGCVKYGRDSRVDAQYDFLTSDEYALDVSTKIPNSGCNTTARSPENALLFLAALLFSARKNKESRARDEEVQDDDRK